MQYQVFTTGDQLWTSQRYGNRVTVKFITNDGLIWEEGDTEVFRRLTGMEKFVHRIEVFLMRGLLKIMHT